MTRSITSIELETGTLLIEGSEVDFSDEIKAELSATEQTARGGERTSAGEPKALASRMKKMIHAVSSTISSSVAEANPDEWEVEFSLGADIKTGVPFVVSNTLEGAIKVKLTWKSASGNSTKNV